MIIEFAGSSCSGKSTLLRRLREEVEARSIPYRFVNAWNSGRRDMLRALRNPRFVLWSLLNPQLLSRRAARQMLGASGIVEALKSETRLILVDEGPIKLHKRRSLRDSRAHHLLPRAVPVPDLLVLVTCDPAERLVRLRQTGRIHALTRSDEALLTDTSGTDYALRFANGRGVPVVEVDTSAGNDAFAELWQRLEPLISPRPAA